MPTTNTKRFGDTFLNGSGAADVPGEQGERVDCGLVTGALAGQGGGSLKEVSDWILALLHPGPHAAAKKDK